MLAPALRPPAELEDTDGHELTVTSPTVGVVEKLTDVVCDSDGRPVRVPFTFEFDGVSVDVTVQLSVARIVTLAVPQAES